MPLEAGFLRYRTPGESHCCKCLSSLVAFWSSGARSETLCWRKESLSSRSETLGTRPELRGTRWESLRTCSDRLETCSERLGTHSETLPTCPERRGTRSDLLATRSASLATRPDSPVTRSAFLNSRPVRLGALAEASTRHTSPAKKLSAQRLPFKAQLDGPAIGGPNPTQRLLS